MMISGTMGTNYHGLRGKEHGGPTMRKLRRIDLGHLINL
jgi:hypothetical protein